MSIVRRPFLLPRQRILRMTARLTKVATASKQKYVCPSCRLHNSSLAGGQTRSRHSGPPVNLGGDGNQESIPKESKHHSPDSTSQASIQDLLQRFLFKPHQKDEKTKNDGNFEVHLTIKTPLNNLIELSVAILADLSLESAARRPQGTDHITQAKGHYR